jgi:uncharacterized protein YwgA
MKHYAHYLEKEGKKMNKTSNLNELILLVVGFIGVVYGRTYMQKIFFLIEKELLTDIDLNFIKYHYGPYSRFLRDSIEDLKNRDLIKDEISFNDGHVGHCFKLTKKGQLVFIKLKNKDDLTIKKLYSFCDRFNEYTPSELLRFVYSKYPDWTTNSLLVNN